jgi:hypothetical protein
LLPNPWSCLCSNFSPRSPISSTLLEIAHYFNCIKLKRVAANI